MKNIFSDEYVWGLVNIGKRLGYSYGEAYRRIKDGRVPAERGGHQWVARASDLDRCRVTQPIGRRRT